MNYSYHLGCRSELKPLSNFWGPPHRAAIDRGRQLKQIDRQIEKLQQQLEKLALETDLSQNRADTSLAPVQERQLSEALPQNSLKITNLAEQERLVKEVLANSQALRSLLRQSTARNRRLRAGIIDLIERNSP